MSRLIPAALAMAVVASAVLAAHALHASQDPQQHAEHSHYAGRESSEIPALTDEQIEQLRSGDGMGMALPAELNHYPGPRHVLDMADDLELTAGQRTRTEAIFAAMQETAQRLGNEIIEAEKQLDMRFQHGHIDAAVLREQTAGIAALYGELRATHLGAHLQMKELLTPEQVARYDELRGYEQR